jgi:hypothetical protein
MAAEAAIDAVFDLTDCHQALLYKNYVLSAV